MTRTHTNLTDAVPDARRATANRAGVFLRKRLDRMALVRVASVALAGTGILLLTGCSGGTAGNRENRGAFRVTQITTGLGQVYPYRIREADAFGNPTQTIVNIDSLDILRANLTANNSVLPVATFPTTAQLPDGQAGNQFLLVRFAHHLDIRSILSDQLANQTNSGLTTSVSLLAYDPSTESTSVLQGRGFVNGFTFYNESGRLVLREAVRKNGTNVQILDSRANGFPAGFSGVTDLVEKNAFVFIADSDGNLGTFETFPANVLIRMIVSNSVRNSDGRNLQTEVCVATTVGADPNPPDVLGFSPNRALEISPGNGETNVDPTTPILVRFNKPVQPLDVGQFFNPQNLIPQQAGMTLSVTASATTFSVLYYADPLTYGDLCNYRLRPGYTMPGQTTVTVTANAASIRGLGGVNLGNTVSTTFSTGDGPGIVNAPVAPDAIYIGIGGSEPGLSVLDMNGFGQGTGDPAISRFPLNPNVGAPGVNPALSPGTSRFNGGSAGALTLVQDSVGNTRLLRSPILGNVGDIHIGCPLDTVFNNENVNRNATRTNHVNPVTGTVAFGNTISVAPHPNPPTLVFPPPNPSRAIFGQEPTVNSSTGPAGTIVTTNPPCIVSPLNLLRTGNPFSNQQTEVGLYGHFMEGVFYGPQPPPASPPPPTPYCPFTSRQQIGHFLYILDRDNRQILVVNSNRMTVLDTIRLTDPFSMTVAPNMRTLAVTNFASASVSFIDIDPTSPAFHTVIAETRVPPGPTSIAWQPDGEDILITSTSSNSLTILGARDFAARRTVTGFLSGPIDVAVTPRYQNTGYLSGIYFAYILNSNGTVAIYESGPDGVNGIGFNDVVGIVPTATFPRPRTIKLDYTNLNGAVLIGHVDDSGLGQISRVELTGSPIGPLPISPNSGGFILPPTFRQKEWQVTQRFGGANATTPRRDLMSGNAPVDFTFDEMVNFGGAPGQVTQFNSGLTATPMTHSGKDALKAIGGAPGIPYVPKLLIVALGDTGKLDVFEVNTGRLVRTIDVPGITSVSSYWRQ
jgi:hypothetical protein